MALTFTSRQGDDSGAVRVSPGGLFATVTTVTIGVAGDYASGGIVLTPAQLSLSTEVLFGVVSVRTVGGAGTAVQGVLDCTNPGAPKLKLNTASAEVAGAGVAGALVDVLAFGN